MREYCLVTKAGTVINMCMSYKPEAPTPNDYQIENGWRWVPVSQVPESKLTAYRYWSERP
jgi:hypothetical protein